MNLHDLIEQAAFAWIAQEKANAQSLPGQIAKAKIDEFNAKRGKKNGGELIEANGNGEEAAKPSAPFKPVTISDTGLELIEAVQFDTTLRKDGVWVSNPALEDKAGPKEKIKGSYTVLAKAFKMKFRNIAGDEIVLDYPPVKA